MALTEQQQQIADDVRLLVGEVDLDAEALYAHYLGAGESLNGAAAIVWGYKASQAADLIDVREGSSTRNLSQLRLSYLDMATRFGALAADEAAPAADRATRTREIARRPIYPVSR